MLTFLFTIGKKVRVIIRTYLLLLLIIIHFSACKRIMSFDWTFYCWEQLKNIRRENIIYIVFSEMRLRKIKFSYLYSVFPLGQSTFHWWKNDVLDLISISRLLFWYKFCHLVLIPRDQLHKKGLTKSIIKRINQEIHPPLPKYVCMMWHWWPEFILCWL